MRDAATGVVIIILLFLVGLTFHAVGSRVGDIQSEPAAVDQAKVEWDILPAIPTKPTSEYPKVEPKLEATAKNFEEWIEAVDMSVKEKLESTECYNKIANDPLFHGMTIISVARSGSSVVVTTRNSMQLSEDIRWTYLFDFSDINRGFVSPIGTTLTHIGEKN